jgi:hypothetical protein
MRWTSGGPDLPPELLQALEDGKLVFFCGAGVSYPAGLPTFRGLVQEVYKRLGEPPQGLEQIEFENHNYDRVFGLLEKRLKSFVRKKVIEILHLDSTANLPSHKALLSLATSRDGMCRLVTTNFDRAFEFASSGAVPIDAAPRLSIPKLGVWNSVVHLHGIITDKEPSGRSLVLTSADFGAAYLTERWASRFISDLFQRFTVLFVGYSVEDPVVRYMMDAFAADRALGEGVGNAYVLAGTTEARRKENTDAWQAKGVDPILYDEADGHNALHVTLAKWADCHQTGLFGKESIIREYCSSTKPVRPFDDDPIVSQVLWAISEPTGHIASVFAHLDPVPPLEWLDVFEEHRLINFPYAAGLPSTLVDAGHLTSNPNPLHPITRALGDWLPRHLDNTNLLNWVLRSGSSLHPELRAAFRRRLDLLSPTQYGLSQIWQVLTLEPPLTWLNVHRPFRILEQLSGGIWNLQVKHELLAALSPELELRPSLMRTMFPDLPEDGTRVSSYSEVEVVFHSRDYGGLIRQAIDSSLNRQQIFSDLADDLTDLLKRTMELFEMVQKADAKMDSSYSDQPSISRHPQNSAFRGWTQLIELLRDAWKQLVELDRNRGQSLVERWKAIPYPIFRRLCFYAMAESDLYSPQECLEYSLENDGWWLWSIYVYREQFRLLNSLWPKLSGEEVTRLTAAIVAGPPRAMFLEGIEESRLRKLSDRSVWLLLAKVNGWGYDLPAAASAALSNLSSRYPAWGLGEGDRDEFPIWTGETIGEPPVENEDEFLNAADGTVVARLSGPVPTGRTDLRKWQRVVVVQSARASKLLSDLAAMGHWPNDVWETLLDGLASAKLGAKEWLLFIVAMLQAPDSLYEKLSRQIAWLLHDVASILPQEADDEFWRAWDRAMPPALQDEDTELTQDPITRAINIPAGLLTQAMLDRLSTGRPRTAADIANSHWGRLTAIADGTTVPHTLARVLLASRLAWLYMLNPDWVDQHLLKYLHWDGSAEVTAVWQGYLWQARVTPELWKVIKDDFLLALGEKPKLRAFEERIATIFGYLSIDQPDWFSTEVVQTALRSTDAKGRAAISSVVATHMEGAGDKSEAMWTTTIGPWLERSWPKDRAFVDPMSALNLALAAAHAGAAFNSAVDLILPFLTKAERYSFVVDRLNGTDLPERNADAVLRLLEIVDTNYMWPDLKLRTLLARVQAAQPDLAHDPKFRILDEYLRQHNF